MTLLKSNMEYSGMDLQHISLYGLCGVLICSALPKPYDLRMEALNTIYIFRWNWNHTQANYSVNFTVEYTFSNLEASYTSISVEKMWCDLSDNLEYIGSYTLRVRAEGNGEKSNWTWLKEFCPDEQANLDPPFLLRVLPGEAMVTVSFNESLTRKGAPMSSILNPMVFRLKYWDTNHPTQETEKTIQTTHHTLPLKPGTEYCLQVQAISEGYQKSSPYTQPQCVTTLGQRHSLAKQLSLAILGFVVLGIFLICIKRQKNKTPTLYIKIPSIILDQPLSHLKLLELEETSCRVSALIAMLTEHEHASRQEIMVIQNRRSSIPSRPDSTNEESGNLYELWSLQH